MFRKTLTYWFCMIIGWITFMIPVFGIILEIFFLIALIAIQYPITTLDSYSLLEIYKYICIFSSTIILSPVPGTIPFLTICFIFTDGIIYLIKELYKYNTPAKICTEEAKPIKYSKKLVCLEVFLFIMFSLCLVQTTIITYFAYFKNN